VAKWGDRVGEKGQIVHGGGKGTSKAKKCSRFVAAREKGGWSSHGIISWGEKGTIVKERLPAWKGRLLMAAFRGRGAITPVGGKGNDRFQGKKRKTYLEKRNIMCSYGSHQTDEV